MPLNKTIKITVTFIFALIATLSLYLFQPIHTTKVLHIPSGSLSYIIQTFINKGYNLNSFDKYFLYLLGYPQKGFIDLGGIQFSKIEFLYKLATSKGATIDIVAVPGDSTYFFLRKIAKDLHLDIAKLEDSYNKKAPYKDGVILCETYKINVNMNEEQIINFLLQSSLSKHKQLSKKYLGSYNKSKWFKYVTIASIIQKEASDNDEMPLVSSVIYNRLKKRMYLQMDGALNYGQYAHKKVTKKRITQDSSLFNTYKHKTIPPYPVSMVGVNSIKSAVFPKKSDYLYFVVNPKTKKHIFSKTYRTHVNHIRNLH